MSFDHLQMPATTGWIFNRVGMTSLGSLLHILLCFQFVPPQNLLYVCFCFANQLARSRPFLQINNNSYFIYEAQYFFFSRKIFVGHLVRHSGVLIVRQISTALLHTHTVSAILFVL